MVRNILKNNTGPKLKIGLGRFPPKFHETHSRNRHGAKARKSGLGALKLGFGYEANIEIWD